MEEKTKHDLITRIFYNQKYHSIHRNHHPPTYTKQELLSFALKSDKFNELFKQWKTNGYQKMLTPSFDRKDDYSGYSLENFNKWCTWQENFDRGHYDRKAGINNKQNISVVSINKTTNKLMWFHSMMEANRQTGISQGSISSCCSNKKNSAGGCYWESIP